MGVIVLAMLSKCRLHCNCTRNTCQLPHFQNLQFLHQYCTRNTWQHSYFKNFLCSAFRLFGTFTFTLANESIVWCVLNILKDYSIQSIHVVLLWSLNSWRDTVWIGHIVIWFSLRKFSNKITNHIYEWKANIQNTVDLIVFVSQRWWSIELA